MNFISVDIEADGPIPGKYSMVALGAVVVEPPFEESFYCTIRPVTELYVPESLSVTGFTREQTLTFLPPEEQMKKFDSWLNEIKAKRGFPVFVSDNAFDWSFVNYYLHYYVGYNIFGHSSWNINSFYKGLKKNFRAKFKKYRITKHSHNALDDAKGNAEAFYHILKEHNLVKHGSKN